jgi:glycosyltransferase involved in cell wall biosynthesis
MPPTISILLPVFNAAPWLMECLNSILQQTNSDWELLAVNDQSTDDSLAILNEFAQTDQRIKVFTTKEKGIIPALRLAFAKSTGQLLTRMDADDVMAPDKLEKLQQCLIANGPGHVATGWVKYISTSTLGDGYKRYEQWLNDLCQDNSHYNDIYRECVLPSPCWMSYREDLIVCGAFDVDRYPEDYDLCFRFYEKDLKVVSVNELLHYWRDHPERTSRNSKTYANQEYFDLKMPWFLKLDYDSNRPLVLWGTGKKGKVLAKKLIAAKIPFLWVTNNVRKIGLDIYGQMVTTHLQVAKLENPQVIVAVSSPEDQKEISIFWDNLKNNGDLYFFC